MTRAFQRRNCTILCFLSIYILCGGTLELAAPLTAIIRSASSRLGDSPGRSSPVAQTQVPPPPRSEIEQEMERKQKKAQRKEEYENTKKLAEQILRLAQELRESIEKAGQDTLPLNAIRKAGEIESLSKKLKGRLRGGV